MSEALSATHVEDTVLQAHAERFGQNHATPSATLVGNAVRDGARAACLRMGFIDIDADCIAKAWQAQTERTGHFDADAWPQDARDFGLRPFPPTERSDAFPPCPEQLGLYAVLPDGAWVGRMARAGVPTVQLRFKSDDPEAVEREVRAAVQAVQGTSALLFINDHWRAAIRAGAYGVHLGQEDLDALQGDELQALRDSGLRLGVSTHGYEEMRRADRVSPSYLAMGAVYPTTLKKMATAPQGVARLAVYASLMRGYPQVGIGGIDEARMPDVLATGVGSVAVVRAIVTATDPEATAQQLMQVVRTNLRLSAPSENEARK